MKTKIKYNEEFQEIANYSSKEIYIRTFGYVELDNNKKVNLLVIGEIYNLDESGACNLSELPDPTKPVMMSFSLLPELNNINKKHIKSAKDSNGGYTTIEDIYEYMGGLRFEPSNTVWFKNMDEARDHLLSKPLNDQISAMGGLSGFTMDMNYNRAGETNWTRLEKIMNG